MSNIQKNRYLQLDGTPAECGEWRRFISPLLLAASVTGSLIGCALPEEKTELSPQSIFMVAASGMAARGFTRRKLIASFANAGLKDFFVDTKSETKKHSCTQTELDKIVYEIKEDSQTSTLGSGLIFSAIGISTYLFSLHPAYQAVAIQLALMPSPLSHSLEGYLLTKKIKKQEWFIVSRSEMQEKEDFTIAPTLSPS